MLLTKEELKRLRETKEVPTASLKILDNLNNINITKDNIEYAKNTKCFYIDYLNEILEMTKENQQNFLRALKASEISDNKYMKKEDSLSVALSRKINKDNAIDCLIENGSPLSEETFLEAHNRFLMETESYRFSKKTHRTDDETFVGRVEDGDYKIRYFALPHKDIKEAISKIIEFYNSDYYQDDLFFQAFIIHGLVAALQIFDDGNTRYSRMLQYIKIGENTNEKLDIQFGTPAMYGTRSYYHYRDYYRELIGNIVLNPNDENWNKWLLFNLKRTEDQIYYLDNKLSTYKKMVRKK